MNEFEFFIKDDVPQVGELAPHMKEKGAILVDNTANLVRELTKHTEPGQHVSVRYSGGVVEDCLLHSTQRLLNSSPGELPFTVDHVTVDMTTSVAYAEQLLHPFTAQQRKTMFINLLGNKLAEDPRLTVLPADK